jgi:hypothetical protein
MSMTKEERRQANRAALAFQARPGPDEADELLHLLSPHRTNPVVANIIHDVLGYRFMVGSIPKSKEAAPG